MSEVANGKAVPADAEELETDHHDPNDIHEILHNLRIQEVYRLGRNPTNIRSVKASTNYFYRVALETSRYVRFVFWTWWGLGATTFVGGLGPFDWFAMFVYAFGGTIVLSFVLVGCLILNSPILKATYESWSTENAGGLGLVNNANPKLFKALTKEQVAAAKEYLTQTFDPKKNTETKRQFSLDAAKLLLQFAAIVYEHPNQAIRKALLTAIESQDGEDTEYMEGLESRYEKLSQSIKSREDLLKKPRESVVEELNSIKEKLLQARRERDKHLHRIHDALDQYDHAGIRGDGVIRTFCDRIGVDFEPLSELGNTSSAFAALFWDPKSNWIVVTFKGTQPIEFGEWLSDLNTKLSHVGSHIPGFKKVHLGFKERVFPEDCSNFGDGRPYDTISRGVKELARWLHARNCTPEQKINVWVTGHSLGCATASLVYARFLAREHEIGAHSDLRDAYIFAAPIVSDRESVEVFNSKMFANPDRPKTMWRVTSNGDFVATCLPELGDYNSMSVSPTNAFAFAHLGTELKLQDGSTRATATGNHLAYGTRILIASKFTQDEIEEQRAKYSSKGGLKEWSRVERGRWYQKFPLVGRFVAHGTVFYWDQLDNLDVDKPALWAWN